jgi:hypothetical protein
MRINRHAGAIVLYGGWLLLFNPQADRPDAPLSLWKKKGGYDTPYLCDRARSQAVADLAREAREKHANLRPADVELRFRCERVERVGPAQRR